MDDVNAAAGKRQYGLFTLTGAPRLRWKFRDEGIAIEGDQLSWRDGDIHKLASLRNVREVHLQCGETRDGTVGTCCITFRNLAKLTISSASAYGLPDEARAAVYESFLKDLHGTIAANTDKDREVDYVGGASPLRFKIGLAAAIAAVLMFVALPIGLLFLTGDLKALWIAGGGVLFVYPVFRSMQRNEPQTYRPDVIPDELLP